jgi:hypothetical protein
LQVLAWTSVGDEYAKGNNQSFTTVLRCIDAMPQPLRRRLHIQLDNCVSENKNQGFFYSLGLLVHYGIFDEIELGYVTW